MFNYRWKISDGYPENNGLKVFSCFSCGGGSTMGYKLAGYNVLGCNEIDKKMISMYIKNHNPKYAFNEPIQTFKSSEKIPDELYDLDILDGSPPCSTFSMAGLRENAWGKNKKFREGQSEQILDTLFFDFIDLANRLKPKVVVAENVKGILFGNAKKYVEKVHCELNKAGYITNHWLLNSSKMGVPQRRERFFLLGIREDIAETVKQDRIRWFHKMPFIDMNFDFKVIPFIEIMTNENSGSKICNSVMELLVKTKSGESCGKVHPNGSYFNELNIDENKVLPTIRGQNTYYVKRKSGKYHENRFGDDNVTKSKPVPTICSSNQYFLENKFDKLNDEEIILASSFPTDYDFCENRPIYVCGMSVPPIMMANVAYRIKKWWFDKIVL